MLSTSNILETNIDTKIASASSLILTTVNLNDVNSSNYVTSTKNILANANTAIENELNILENIILPAGKTLLNNDAKIIHTGYKDRFSLNYSAIADAFINPLEQVDKEVNDNNAVSILNYLINRPFLYVVGNILQANADYNMVQGVVAYLLNNNNTTFSFTTKLSITDAFNTYNLHDIGDNNLNYTRTPNNLNLNFKQQTTRDFETITLYLNSPLLLESYTISTILGIQIGVWNIPNNNFTNWNDDPRNYVMVDIDTAIKMYVSTGKQLHFFFDSNGGLVRHIRDFRFLIRLPYNLEAFTNQPNPLNIWSYDITVTWFGEDGVRSTAIYPRSFTLGAGEASVFIVNINKRIKDITFKYEVKFGTPKWMSEACFVILEQMFIIEEVITQGNEVVEYNISLPPYTEDAQISKEKIANNVKIFYNSSTYNMPLPIYNAINRSRTTNTQANGQVILKIGDNNSRWYNMAFRFNAIWSNSQKIALIDEYKYIGADVKIKSLEVDNIILNGTLKNLSFNQIQGGIIQDAGLGKRRSVIEDVGSFTYTNEIIPSISLINGTIICYYGIN